MIFSARERLRPAVARSVAAPWRSVGAGRSVQLRQQCLRRRCHRCAYGCSCWSIQAASPICVHPIRRRPVARRYVEPVERVLMAASSWDSGSGLGIGSHRQAAAPRAVRPVNSAAGITATTKAITNGVNRVLSMATGIGRQTASGRGLSVRGAGTDQRAYCVTA